MCLTTMNSLRALRTIGHVYVTALPAQEGGIDAMLERIRQQLGTPPFGTATAGGEVTVTIETTFTANCIGPLQRTIGLVVAAGKCVVLDVPSQGLGPQILLAIQDLTRVRSESVPP